MSDRPHARAVGARHARPPQHVSPSPPGLALSAPGCQSMKRKHNVLTPAQSAADMEGSVKKLESLALDSGSGGSGGSDLGSSRVHDQRVHDIAPSPRGHHTAARVPEWPDIETQSPNDSTTSVPGFSGVRPPTDDNLSSNPVWEDYAAMFDPGWSDPEWSDPGVFGGPSVGVLDLNEQCEQLDKQCLFAFDDDDEVMYEHIILVIIVYYITCRSPYARSRRLLACGIRDKYPVRPYRSFVVEKVCYPIIRGNRLG